MGESRKSSANPDLMRTIAGVYVHQVSCGETHTLMIARNEEKDEKILDNIPQYDPKMCPWTKMDTPIGDVSTIPYQKFHIMSKVDAGCSENQVSSKLKFHCYVSSVVEKLHLLV